MSSLQPESTVISDIAKPEEGLPKDNAALQMEQQSEKDRAGAAIHLAEAKMNLAEPMSQKEAQQVENLEWRALGYRPRSGSVSAEAKSYAAKQAQQEKAGTSDSINKTDDASAVAETRDSHDEAAQNGSIKNEATEIADVVNGAAQKNVPEVSEREDNSHKTSSPKDSPKDDTSHNVAPTFKPEGNIAANANTDTNVTKNISEEKENTGPVKATKRFLEEQFQHAIDVIKPKMINDPGSINTEDASLLLSTEVRAHGTNRKASEGGIAAQAEALAKQNEAKRAAEEKNAKSTTEEKHAESATEDVIAPA